MQAYQPILPESAFAAYLTGSYLDYPTAELDRLTLDAGVVKELAGEGGPRIRAGIEAGTFGDRRLYDFPYLGYLQPLLRVGRRRYGAVDPLFGEERVDRRTRIDFSVRSKQWRWMNFVPAVVLSVDKTRSNIGFYSYEKANVSLVME